MAVRTQLKCRYAGGVSWERKRSIRSLESTEGLKEDGASRFGRRSGQGEGGCSQRERERPVSGSRKAWGWKREWGRTDGEVR